MEFGPRKIRVIGIAPGFVETEGNVATREQATPHLVTRTPLGRTGQPADIAAAVSYTCSDDAAWVTGETIQVGGRLVF